MRGYDEREVNTDEGYIFTTELRTPTISLGRTFRPSRSRQGPACNSSASGTTARPTTTRCCPAKPSETPLSSVGGGLRYTINTYVSVRFDYGFQLLHTGFDNDHGSRSDLGDCGELLRFCRIPRPGLNYDHDFAPHPGLSASFGIIGRRLARRAGQRGREFGDRRRRIRRARFLPFRSVERGQALPIGSTVRTGDDGTATLVTTPGSAIKVGNNSLLKINDLAFSTSGGAVTERKARLQLTSGVVSAMIDPSTPKITDFKIQTPQGVAAARGTFYAVIVKHGKSYVLVDHGKVGVLADQYTAAKALTHPDTWM